MVRLIAAKVIYGQAKRHDGRLWSG